MKRKKLFLAIGIVAAVICCGALMRWAFIQVFFAEPAVMETAVSPDGKYIAYAYESNGGATSGWTYHVSVLKAGQKLHKGNGNIYISSIPPNEIRWEDDGVLYIDDYRSSQTTKRKEKIYDIIVVFNSIELEKATSE